MTTTVTTHGSFTLVTTVMPRTDNGEHLKEHERNVKSVTENTPVNVIKPFTTVNSLTQEFIRTTYCGTGARPAL
jgi:hypothetical protein